jgi:hypothetical protein
VRAASAGSHRDQRGPHAVADGKAVTHDVPAREFMHHGSRCPADLSPRYSSADSLMRYMLRHYRFTDESLMRYMLLHVITGSQMNPS